VERKTIRCSAPSCTRPCIIPISKGYSTIGGPSDVRLELCIIEYSLWVPLDKHLEVVIDQRLRGRRGERRTVLEWFLLAPEPDGLAGLCLGGSPGGGRGGVDECLGGGAGHVAGSVCRTSTKMSFDDMEKVWNRVARLEVDTLKAEIPSK